MINKRLIIVLAAIAFLAVDSQVVGQGINRDSLLQRMDQGVSATQEIDILNELAFSYVYSNPTVAQDDVNISLTKANNLNYLRGKANAYNVLGGINWAKGNYPRSLDFYQESLSIFSTLQSDSGRAMAYNNIGEVYKKLKDFQMSLSYHKKSLELSEELFGKDKPLMSYINLGEIYLAQDSLDKAKDLYLKIVNNPDTTNYSKLAYAYMGLGQIHAKRRNYSNAENNYFRAVELRKRLNENRGIADSYIQIGNLLEQQGLLESSDIYYKKALTIAHQIEAKDLKMRALLGRVVVDSSRQDYMSALRHYGLYIAVKDSTFNKEKSDQIARMQNSYQTELLKKQNEANQIKVEQQNAIVIGVIIALVLSGSVAVAFYRQRRTQQEVNKLLAVKNQEINLRNDEIEKQSVEVKKLNERLESLNIQLEQKVKSRTKILSHQNDLLSQYAFTNAHELRAPVANILGLVHLLEKTELRDREKDVVVHLKTASDRLDEVIGDIRKRLESSEELLSETHPSKS